MTRTSAFKARSRIRSSLHPPHRSLSANKVLPVPTHMPRVAKHPQNDAFGPLLISSTRAAHTYTNLAATSKRDSAEIQAKQRTPRPRPTGANNTTYYRNPRVPLLHGGPLHHETPPYVLLEFHVKQLHAELSSCVHLCCCCCCSDARRRRRQGVLAICLGRVRGVCTRAQCGGCSEHMRAPSSRRELYTGVGRARKRAVL